MKLNRKNKVLILGIVLSLYLSYSLAIKKTIVYYKEYKSNNELISNLNNNPKLLSTTSRSNGGYLFHSYDDHRMATAGAIIGLAVSGVVVENIETTKKTLPDFPAMWQKMLGSNNFGSNN